MSNTKLYEEGLKVRREVLGAEWVDPQMERASKEPFTKAIQDMVTEYCWGYGWTREGLSKRDRSMMNLVMLTSLGKMTEFKGHVRGAINNGLTADEIREILIHATIYCGVPAGVDAFRNAGEVLREMGKI